MCKYCLQWNHGEYRFHIKWIRCWGFLGHICFQFNLSEGKEYLHHKRVPLNSWHDSLKAEILVKLSENPTHYMTNYIFSLLDQSIQTSRRACQISFQPFSLPPILLQLSHLLKFLSNSMVLMRVLCFLGFLSGCICNTNLASFGKYFKLICPKI